MHLFIFLFLISHSLCTRLAYTGMCSMYIHVCIICQQLNTHNICIAYMLVNFWFSFKFVLSIGNNNSSEVLVESSDFMIRFWRLIKFTIKYKCTVFYYTHKLIHGLVYVHTATSLSTVKHWIIALFVKKKYHSLVTR